MLWSWREDAARGIKALRQTMQLGYLITHPSEFAKLMRGPWTWGAMNAFEDVLRARIPFYSRIAQFADELQFKSLSKYVEQLIHSDPDTWADLFGKPGRLFSRALGGFGAFFDLNDSVDAFHEGHIWRGEDGSITSGAIWNGVQGIAALASVVPGLGIPAGAVSLAMLVVEYRDTLADVASATLDRLQGLGGTVIDGLQAAGSGLLGLIGDGAEWVYDEGTELVGDVADGVQSAGDGLIGAVGDGVDWVGDQGENLVDGAGDLIDDAGDVVGGWFD